MADPSPDAHLPAGTRPGRVVLCIADLERSVAWYERVLGTRVLARAGERATLGAHDDDAVLVELREHPGAAPVPPHGRLGLYHFALLLPGRADLGRFVRHLARLGIRAGAADHLVSEALYLHDPDGLGIEVYADRPRDGWLHADGQLVMASDPLDLDDLAGAAGDREWAGMPAGTAVGHLHLHVGDLDRARAFYADALGLVPTVWSYPGALFLAAGGYHHHLGVNTWARGAAPARDGDARLEAWELVLPSADAARFARGRIAAAGFETGDDGDVFVVRDPWGTELRIVPPAAAIGTN
jgi:catechol 2,3-dioxygenase